MTSDWTPWPNRTHQDHLAFATDWREIANPATFDLAGILPGEDPQNLRRITAVRIAKALAYSIPDFSKVTRSICLPIGVVAQHERDFEIYTRDPQAVAELLGVGEVRYSRLGEGVDPPAIVMFLLPTITENMEAFGAAQTYGALMVGFGATRLTASLQSLYAHFRGYGHANQFSCGLGAGLEHTPDEGGSMAHGWTVGPYPSSMQSDALITLEGQMDEAAETPDGLHPLAGSIVRLGSHEVYVHHSGAAVDLATGQIGRCTLTGSNTYDLHFFPVRLDGSPPSSPAELVRMGAGPVDHAISQRLLDIFQGALPSFEDGDLAEQQVEASSMDDAWYPHHDPMTAMAIHFEREDEHE